MFWRCYGDYNGTRNRVRPFIKYLVSRFLYEQKKITFEVYVTDALKGLLNNTVGLHKECVAIEERYAELINPDVKGDIEDAEEKASEIIEKIKKGVNAL